MRGSGKKAMLVVTATIVAIWAFADSSSAQTSGSIADDPAHNSSTGAGVAMEMVTSPPTPASVIAQKKAYDAMTTLPDSPPIAADRKAAAAMSR